VKSHDRALIEAVLRRDLTAFTQRCFQTIVPGQMFLPNWHVEAITYELERVRRGETRRLIITLPPRNLKSICASVAFPAFMLGHDPSVRIVCASYAQDLTAKLARDCRIVMERAWYKQLFPRTRIDPRKNAESEFETTARGCRLGTSVGGTLTGRGGNLILIDDPMKPAEAMSETKRSAVTEWYDSTLSSRLDSKTEGAIVLIMQRLHVDDLVGHVLEKGTPWTQLDLPAIADAPQEIAIGPNKTYRREIGEILHPEREPRSVLDELRATMGSSVFSAQYQQMPVPPEGALIKKEWLRYYTESPDLRSGGRIVQSWDTASKANKKNDYSVCTTWLEHKSDYFLLDVFRDRLEYPALRRRIIDHAKAGHADIVLIEDASSGTHLVQDLCDEGIIRPIAIRPEREKIVRVEARCATIEAGHVWLPESAPWLDDFLSEVLSFPNGRYDDQVDSMTQFLTWVRDRYDAFGIG
jgi:predicted phage terminase large subunit-like protein